MLKTDLYGNKIEEIFIRELKSSEKTNPSSISNMAKIPNKEGYQKVYKPFGESGRGYYYFKIIKDNKDMYFKDAVRKHIKVLDSIQKRLRKMERWKDGNEYFEKDFIKLLEKHPMVKEVIENAKPFGMKVIFKNGEILQGTEAYIRKKLGYPIPSDKYSYRER